MRSTANLEIRASAKRQGVFLWQVADSLGISESHFCRKLRFELPADEREKILAIIAGLSGKKAEAS